MQVVLAIPDRNLRLALELFLDQEPGVFLVGVAAEAAGADALVRTLNPDALIMSWNLPGCAPQQLLTELMQRPAPPQVIVLAGDERGRSAALAAGAAACVLNWDPPDDLIDAVRRFRPREAAPDRPPAATAEE